MIGYPFRSWTRQVIALALGVFIAVFLTAFVCAVLRPLLPVFLAIAGIATVAGVMLRWRLFRYRGW